MQILAEIRMKGNRNKMKRDKDKGRNMQESTKQIV